MRQPIILISIFMIFSFCTNKTKEEIFWRWFEKNNLRYLENVDSTLLRESLFDDIDVELKRVHKELTFEFEPKNKNGCRALTISADGIKENFSAVIKLVESAPEIKNWKINAFRQRVPGDDLIITLGDFKISYSDIFFKYTEEDDKIGVDLFIKNYDGSATTHHAVYLLFDSLIGEYDTETIISGISWSRLDESEDTDLLPFIKLRDVIDKKK